MDQTDVGSLHRIQHVAHIREVKNVWSERRERDHVEDLWYREIRWQNLD
jgi:hypothetical protein